MDLSSQRKKMCSSSSFGSSEKLMENGGSDCAVARERAHNERDSPICRPQKPEKWQVNVCFRAVIDERVPAAKNVVCITDHSLVMTENVQDCNLLVFTKRDAADVGFFSHSGTGDIVFKRGVCTKAVFHGGDDGSIARVFAAFKGAICTERGTVSMRTL